jgi:Opioid growth factor receptor (OGFr) conserved region
MSEHHSQIIKFLRGEGTDHKGRTISQVRILPDHRLEKSHDIIQWLFPSDMKSGHSPQAPILTDADIEIMRFDERIQNQITMSLDRMIKFYQKDDYWITQKNHNFLRITRILRCLWLAGRKHDYVCLQHCLDDIWIDYHDIIEDSFYYWKFANDREFFNHPEKYIEEHKRSIGKKANPYNNDEPGGGYDDADDQDHLFNHM